VISSFEKQIMISGSRHAPAGLPRPVSPDVVMSEDGAVSWETHHYIAANINHTNRMLKHYYNVVSASIYISQGVCMPC
jgi:hypothetical protein